MKILDAGEGSNSSAKGSGGSWGPLQGRLEAAPALGRLPKARLSRIAPVPQPRDQGRLRRRPRRCGGSSHRALRDGIKEGSRGKICLGHGALAEAATGLPARQFLHRRGRRKLRL